jgi:chitinase
MLEFYALPLLAGLASARMQHVRRSGSTADAHCRLAARLTNGTDPASASGTQNSTVAAAWFEGWNANYTVANVSWDKYTHVTYSFAVTTAAGPLDLSGSGGEEGLKAFVAAAHNASVKALVSVGGWTGSGYWSPAVGSAENRTAFVQALGKLVSDYDLDGLDFE